MHKSGKILLGGRKQGEMIMWLLWKELKKRLIRNTYIGDRWFCRKGIL